MLTHEDDRWAYSYNILLIEFAATDDKEEKRKARQICTLNDQKANLFTYKADLKRL